MNTSFLVIALTCVCVQADDSTRLHDSGTVPDGLAKSDWQSIRAAYEDGRHAFKPVADGWQARNPGQQWTTTFDGRGFLAEPRGGGWQWGLELQSYGFGENQISIPGTPAVKAGGPRLTYQWDAVVEEWWVNDMRGLEHGFTVKARPTHPSRGLTDSPSPSLEFLLAVRGGLRPEVEPGGQSVRFIEPGGGVVLTYSGLKVWDADGRVLPAKMSRARDGVKIAVQEAGARYPLTVDPIVQAAYLKPAAVGTTQVGDLFGYSVAVSGDTVVIGAPFEDSGTTGVNSTPNESAADSGAAYVFVRNGTTWTQQAYLKAGNTGAFDGFGWSVAVSGDTVVVGAPFEDSAIGDVNNPPNEGASGSGAAYVFVRGGTTWTQQAFLKPVAIGVTQAGDGFGYSVAVSGDTVVVGVPFEDSSVPVTPIPNESAANAGAVNVYVRNGTTWTHQAYLKPGNIGGGDLFGNSVAVSGDSLVVGANQEDSTTTGVNSTPNDASGGLFNSGAAYVFIRSGTIWTQQAYLKASNTGGDDGFGYSVAMSRDTVVVGSLDEDSTSTGVNSTPNEGASSSGAAYVFTRFPGTTTWTQQAYLKAGNAGPGDRFGRSVAVSGDTVVVGAEGEGSSTTGVNSTPDESALGAGAAYVFLRSGATWTQHSYLKSGNTGANDHFGFAVAVSGNTVVVGAQGESSSTTGINSTPNESAEFSGAGYTFIALEVSLERPTGTPLADGMTADLGNVATGASGTPQTFTIRNTNAVDLTGLTLSVDGLHPGDFAVSAPSSTTVPAGGTVTFTITFTPGGRDFRTATLHYGVSGELTMHDLQLGGMGGLNFALLSAVQQAYAKPAAVGTSQMNDGLGVSVAVSGNTVVVGALLEDSSTTGVNSTPNESATDTGAAYVFVRNGGTWTQQAYLKASNPGPSDRFSLSVAISGDTVVVGAPIEDSSTTGVNSTPNESAMDAGAAYVFVRNGTTWTQQTYLKASNTGANDRFGSSVAVSGNTVVVGAPHEASSTTGVNSPPDEGAPNAGAAYVFVRNGTTWTQQAYLKASNTEPVDLFGSSVAISGETVVVGAVGEDSSTTGVNATPNESALNSGAAYLFVRSGTTWTQQAYLKASNTGPSEQFGYSVAISGDTVVVGAIEEDSSTTGVNSTPNEGATRAGAAYLFVRSGTMWAQQAYLKASNPEANDLFGNSVAISGDRVVIGAVEEDSNTTGINGTPDEGAAESGAAYVFVRSGTTWTQQAYLKATNTGAQDRFGSSVAVSGDTVVVGLRARTAAPQA